MTTPTTIKINPQLIGFDIDGVVADTAEAFLRIASQQYGYSNFTINDITEFDVAKCLPMEENIVDEIFNKLLQSPIEADLRPMPGSVKVLSKLAQKSPVTFITARPDKEPIDLWLKHILPSPTFNRVQLIAMGDHDGKPTYIRQLGLQYFIDDRAQTCIDLQHAGISSIVFSQPWNEGQHSLPTVTSWQEIEALWS